MISIDTNILVRFLVKDDLIQSNKVLDLFEKCEAGKTQLFISNGVLLECIWVLRSAYNIDESKIIDAFSKLFYVQLFEFENRPAVAALLKNADKAECEIDDLFLACISKSNHSEIMITFDKKASKYDHFELLT